MPNSTSLRPIEPQPSLVRSEFAESTAACQSSVLTPANDLGLPPGLRIALAARMCRLIGLPKMAEAYLAEVPAEFAPIAEGGPGGAPQLAAIARHVDLVTKTPATAARADIEALVAAGLTTPQIVALSELIAFINYETRVLQGLLSLEDRA